MEKQRRIYLKKPMTDPKELKTKDLLELKQAHETIVKVITDELLRREYLEQSKELLKS